MKATLLPPSRPRTAELGPAALGALLLVGTLLLFSRSFRNGFVNYDDPNYVTANPVVQGGLTRAGLAWAFTGAADYWHPLAWLSHMLDCQLYGMSPAGHHLTSVLWHALNAVLAFQLFRALTGRLGASAFAAALFAWHPLRVESVAWVSERKDLMSGCFFLLTLLAYLRYARARVDGRSARGRYLLALGCFAAGLMSKPMLVTLPLLLLVLDRWPLARDPRQCWAEKLPFFALSGAVAWATLRMQRDAGAFVLDLPPGARLENAAVSLARYLGKFLWPVGLSACYRHPGFWPGTAVAGAACLLLALAALAWRQRRRRPWIAAGLAWYLIMLLPVLGLVQAGFQSMADRYTYLSLLGIELAALASLPPPATRAARLARRTAAAAALAACALRTWNQEGVWKNGETLFRHAVAVDARSDVAESFLASALVAEGHPVEARAHAERARQLNPRNDGAMVTLAMLDEGRGRTEEAAALYREALAARPGNPQVECQLGLLELNRGRPEAARALMLPALRSSPSARARTLELSRLALGRGAGGPGLFLFDLVLAAAPAEAEAAAQGDAALLGHAADFQARQGDFGAAIRLYRRATALAPGDARAHAALGYLLIHAGDRRGGAAEWRRALELQPDFPELRARLGALGDD
ncbi:MAG TPA: tetratricopeptide repeat protein [Opitutaceae bacterium]|nr:tetratricopeptide repeat protein [Opitutaceae bacterium]